MQLFFESAIAIPQLEGSTSATFKAVAPQPQLRNSAIAIFSDDRNLRTLIPQFFANFWPWNLVGVNEKNRR